MIRLIIAVAGTAVAVVFVMANTHSVELSLVFGSPVEVRLIFLLMSTFLLGVLVSSFVGMISKLRLKRRIFREVRKEKQRERDEAPVGDLVAE